MVVAKRSNLFLFYFVLSGSYNAVLYAIWGYSSNISSVTAATENSTLPTPSIATSGSAFYGWYTSRTEATYSGDVTFNYSTYYSSYSQTRTDTYSSYSYVVFDGYISDSTLQTGVYTYYMRTQYTFTVTFAGTARTGLYFYKDGSSQGKQSSYTSTTDFTLLEGNFVFICYYNAGDYSTKCFITVFENFEYYKNQTTTASYYTAHYYYQSGSSSYNRYFYVVESGDTAGNWDKFTYCTSSDSSYRIGKVDASGFVSYTVAKGDLTVSYGW